MEGINNEIMTCPFSDKNIFYEEKGWVIKDLKVAKALLQSDIVRAPLIHEFDNDTNSFFLALSHSEEHNLPRLKKVIASFFTYRNIQNLSNNHFYSNDTLEKLDRNVWYDLERDYLFPFVKDAVFSTLGVKREIGNEILKMITLLQKYENQQEDEFMKATYHLIFDSIAQLIQEGEINVDGFIHHIKNYNDLTINEKISFIYPFFEMLGTNMTIELPSITLKNIAKNSTLQSQFKENKSLFYSIFEESARLLENITVHRVAKENFNIGNKQINKGQKVRIKVSEANTDPTVFLNSKNFDEKRENSSESISFGSGLHFCLGKEFMRTITFIVCSLFTNYKINFNHDFTKFSIVGRGE